MAIISTFGCLAQTETGASFAVEGVEFQSIFGVRPGEPQVTYCLLGRGFFLADRSNSLDSLLLAWSQSHPTARLVPVASYGPTKIDDPESKMIYSWIVDDKDTLNLHLVKYGAYAGRTMLRPQTWEELPEREKEMYRESGEKSNVVVEVDLDDYEKFLIRLESAEQFAAQNQYGVWANKTDEK